MSLEELDEFAHIYKHFRWWRQRRPDPSLVTPEILQNRIDFARNYKLDRAVESWFLPRNVRFLIGDTASREFYGGGKYPMENSANHFFDHLEMYRDADDNYVITVANEINPQNPRFVRFIKECNWTHVPKMYGHHHCYVAVVNPDRHTAAQVRASSPRPVSNEDHVYLLLRYIGETGKLPRIIDDPELHAWRRRHLLFKGSGKTDVLRTIMEYIESVLEDKVDQRNWFFNQ